MPKQRAIKNNTRLIEKCLAEKAWTEARHYIQEDLTSTPTDHWLWFTLGLTYYEDKLYGKALDCSRTAVEFQPGCPLALWHYAGSLFMNDREHLAFVIWIRLLDMDLEDMAYGDHGEGMDWALRLVNDVHYKLARYYQWAGKEDQAAESIKKHIHNRNFGVQSIYSLQEATALVEELGVGR